MNYKKRIFSIITAISLMFSVLAACGSKDTVNSVPFDSDTTDSIASETVASNSRFDLQWDNDAKFVMLRDKKTEKIWSNIPYEYYLSMGTSANVNSTLNITVSNSQTLKWDNLNGYNEAFLDGRITAEKLDNGVKLTYYFDKFKISVPVNYVLREDSLEVSVNPSEISENSDYSVVSVAPSPFLCSAVNSKEDSYLFIPTGSGALMYTDERAEGDRIYSGEVYGEDGSRMLTEAAPEQKEIRLPVYGVKDKNDALFAVIESGAESAMIEAAAGNSRTGYSNVYSNFYLRSYDKISSGIQSLNYEDITKVSEHLMETKIKIAYYPLSEDRADYMGMADIYKEYLDKNEMMNKSDSSSNTYGVNIFGGVLTSSSFLGMPSKKLDVMTTFTEAKEIIEKLTESSDMKPEIMLTGFGNNGISPGKIAGGFGFSSDYGSKKQRLSLEDFCKDNNIGLYTDFDLIRYSSSGGGFNYTFDSAKSASLQAVEKSPVEIPLRRYSEQIEYRLLKREKVEAAVKKLGKTAEKLDVSGIGLSSLGSIAYSDYSDEAYYSKGSMSLDVTKFINQLHKNGKKVAVSDANAYAAASGSAVFSAPVNNGEYYIFDEAIPFYEMVFVGNKPIYSSAVNTAENFDKQVMLSLIGGARLSFDLVHEFDISDLDFQSERLYATVFEHNLGLIEETLKKYQPFYSAISDNGIKTYEKIDGNVSKTVFENGVVLYANHTSNTVQSPMGELGAYETIWTDK